MALRHTAAQPFAAAGAAPASPSQAARTLTHLHAPPPPHTHTHPPTHLCAQLDTAATHAPPGGEGDDYGADRLSNVADTWHGQELDPERFLGPERHGEWTPSSGAGARGSA
jgi:hypothetical protein